MWADYAELLDTGHLAIKQCFLRRSTAAGSGGAPGIGGSIDLQVDNANRT
jgi:hypothetical protein